MHWENIRQSLTLVITVRCRLIECRNSFTEPSPEPSDLPCLTDLVVPDLPRLRTFASLPSLGQRLTALELTDARGQCWAEHLKAFTRLKSLRLSHELPGPHRSALPITNPAPHLLCLVLSLVVNAGILQLSSHHCGIFLSSSQLLAHYPCVTHVREGSHLRPVDQSALPPGRLQDCSPLVLTYSTSILHYAQTSLKDHCWLSRNL